ncbi:TPA: hypothetical protein ACK8Z3_000506 [Legionella pneumophila]|uniref:Secreted protein n=1 Tax=Legionella pneumophila subsp. pneumophila TaxID=91891 RepID=A0A3A6VYC3_LEGPN|nr:hypothetical protein [Legionella pneumophila]ERH43552.1 hypothetical protein N750_11750 [Legionella pneumophila str. Leg01/53]ERH45759.1 hypothetical protein N751_09755 [Legionella pneumophila str. Leg01/11]ERI47833.1 hypothetical protein N749_12820 [Legionella pneumophila str. Leg01/20]ANN95758.1 hypothetical protein A9P84_08560 [Legionella pneumophila]ERB40926.1 hypothetical protein N748_11570 [Legionella pneumophila str. 121004]
MKTTRLFMLSMIAHFLLTCSVIHDVWAEKTLNPEKLANTTITLISNNQNSSTGNCSLQSVTSCTILLHLANPGTPGRLYVTNHSFVTATNIEAVLPSSLESLVNMVEIGCDEVPPGGTCTIYFYPISGPISPQPVQLIGDNIRTATFYLGIVM